jgi:hypothetical protein
MLVIILKISHQDVRVAQLENTLQQQDRPLVVNVLLAK